MTLDRLITTAINTIMRRLLNLGITKGIDMAAGKGKSQAQMTPEERKQAQNARAAVKRARQAARITRRLR
ncbi:hypothetical protein [Paenirhodobacter sp. CAU 1674]|jgi:hypothetical protein|uniref:hypothetical protein n=1 Tax=Paenirhodobacter sp. CAU 1674 TaxID=3032596 RepID=UPI0023D9B79C|nr:hypothetical protein [Paenirhodobacter sp. CAU 1674]MDF2140016.1 hypothetical protein [Paenirhodobacter sp. CAU 1674]